MTNPAPSISRLAPEQAHLIVECFRRVYGDAYGDEDFSDPDVLARRMRQGKLYSVGVIGEDQRLVAHMGMTRIPGATVAELGNSVAVREARGQGLIWKLGAELVAWSVEFGDHGFVDYPTTAHDVMQRQSARTGGETGLMFGYIPSDGDGSLGDSVSALRLATTIAYHHFPSATPKQLEQFVPKDFGELVQHIAGQSGLERSWVDPATSVGHATTSSVIVRMKRRGVDRLSVSEAGADIAERIAELDDGDAPCRQIDFAMSDPGIGVGVTAAQKSGYSFCGWLPGFLNGDALRLQWVDEGRTDTNPVVVNPVAKRLLKLAQAERANRKPK